MSTERPPTMRDRIAVLSTNIFIRPEGIHSGAWLSAGDHKDLRASLLLRKMQSLDLVILQEMFEVGVRQRRFVRRAEALGFKYHAGSVWPTLTDTRLIDGGLLILSRFPIVERAQHAFTQGAGSDGVCAKGVLYARVQLSPDLSDSLHVFTTHTQAGDRPREYGIRHSQLRELTTFVAHSLRDDPYSPLLITGDLNLDARHDLTHDDHGHIHSRPCSESLVYQTLFNDLHGVLAAGRKLQDLMKLYDTTKLEGNVHPITNGDGHASLVHTGDPLSHEKDGKCIDYFFFSPGIRERRSISGDMPMLHLSVVPEETHVDHGDVASILTDEDLENPLPITHLSDHYGLRATFEIELTPVMRPDGSPAPPDMRLCEILHLHFPPRAFAQRTKNLWQWKVRMVLLLIGAASGSALYLIARVLQTVVSRGRALTSA